MPARRRRRGPRDRNVAHFDSGIGEPDEVPFGAEPLEAGVPMKIPRHAHALQAQRSVLQRDVGGPGGRPARGTHEKVRGDAPGARLDRDSAARRKQRGERPRVGKDRSLDHQMEVAAFQCGILKVECRCARFELHPRGRKVSVALTAKSPLDARDRYSRVRQRHRGLVEVPLRDIGEKVDVASDVQHFAFGTHAGGTSADLSTSHMFLDVRANLTVEAPIGGFEHERRLFREKGTERQGLANPCAHGGSRDRDLGKRIGEREVRAPCRHRDPRKRRGWLRAATSRAAKRNGRVLHVDARVAQGRVAFLPVPVLDARAREDIGFQPELTIADHHSTRPHVDSAAGDVMSHREFRLERKARMSGHEAHLTSLRQVRMKKIGRHDVSARHRDRHVQGAEWIGEIDVAPVGVQAQPVDVDERKPGRPVRCKGPVRLRQLERRILQAVCCEVVRRDLHGYRCTSARSHLGDA